MKCYCGSDKNFYQCCFQLLDHKKVAASPEQLMRARYSAFVTKNFKYLRDTTAPEAADEKVFQENEKWATQVEFQSLKVIKAEENDVKGQVEIIIHFSDNKTVYGHQEIALFRKIKNLWFYVDSKSL